MKQEIYISVEDGKMTSGRRLFINLLNSLTAGRYVLILEKARKKRSGQQNRYYFAIVGMVQEGLKQHGIREDKETVHRYLKSLFLKKESYSEKTGEVFSFIRSTTDLSVDEMIEFIENIKQWASETLGVYIPDAGSQVELSH